MSVATKDAPMGRPKNPIPTTHVRMHEPMAEQLRTIAFHRKMDIAELLSRLFKGRVKREYLATLRSIEEKRRDFEREI